MCCAMPAGVRHSRAELCGFFAENDLKIGEHIENEVDNYCQRAFALVQLVEPLSFDSEPPKNWCYHEYDTFTE